MYFSVFFLLALNAKQIWTYIPYLQIHLLDTKAKLMLCSAVPHEINIKEYR